MTGLAAKLSSMLARGPTAFRQDPVFRHAIIGAGLALLALLGRLGGAPGPAAHVPGPASPAVAPSPPPALPAAPLTAKSTPSAPVPPPAALGAEYGAPASAAAPANDPPRIAPGRRLDGHGPASPSALDRFGVVPRASPEKDR